MLALLLFVIFTSIIGFSVIFGLALVVVGLIWMPFAAFISWRIAKGRALPPTRYAIAGAIYYALFLFPWFYLVATQRGKSVSNGILRLAYILLYAIWMIGPIFSVASSYGIDTSIPDHPIYGTDDYEQHGIVLGSLALMLFAWILSLVNLLRHYYGRAKVNPVLNWNYLAPPALFLVSVVAVYPLMYMFL